MAQNCVRTMSNVGSSTTSLGAYFNGSLISISQAKKLLYSVAFTSNIYEQDAFPQKLTGRMQWRNSSTWRQLPDWSWRLCHPSLQHPEWMSLLLGEIRDPRGCLGSTRQLKTKVTVARHWVRTFLPVLSSDCAFGCPPFQIFQVAQSCEKINWAVFHLIENIWVMKSIFGLLFTWQLPW